MRLFPITLVAFGVALSGCTSPGSVASMERRDPVYAGLVGKWQGIVEEPDLLDSSRRIRRAASVLVQAVPKSDGLEMHFATGAPASRHKVTTDLLQLDKSMTAARWGDKHDATPQQFDVTLLESSSDRAPLTVVLEGSSDPGTQVTIRETVTIAPGEIHIVQETRTCGADFAFRRAYVLRRVG